MAKKTTEARDLALKKLAGSGLNEKDMKLLGMEPLAPNAVKSLDETFKSLPGLKIPYFDPDGKRRAFFRLRYLTTPPSAFGEVAAKPQRYVQPPKTGTAAYFPRNFKWNGELKDTKHALFITEGELKAACACKLGLPTVGLGGVFNFQSAKSGVALLPELLSIDWKGRVVYVTFDSDYRTNPLVLLALERLIRVFTSLGAVPRVIDLPKLDAAPGAKTGLDDFLVSEGVDAFHDLVAETTDTPLAKTLWEWNERFAFITNPGSIVVDRTTSQRYSAEKFENQDFRHHRITIATTTADGSPKLKEMKIPTLWLDWPHRAQLDGITYLPGRPSEADGKWNLWRGWGAESKKGDIRPWLKLMDHVFTGATKEDRLWFERWAAYPIQHPGTKLYSAVVLWGDEQGTGKSLVGYSLGRVYGADNFADIGQEELTSTFNDWAKGKQFILGDDVTGHDNRAYADKLKKMITQPVVRINEKFMPAYTVPDCINYIFTTNQSNAFYLEDHDRRYFIHHVIAPRMDLDFARAYDAWYRSPEGAGALRYYLEHLDLGKFNPRGFAPQTAAKVTAIEESKSDVGVWVSDLKRSPDTILPDLVTARQVLSEYERTTGRTTNLSVNGMARELRKAGFKQYYNGAPIRAGTTQHRYFIIRNDSKWMGAHPDDARTYLESQHVEDVKTPKY